MRWRAELWPGRCTDSVPYVVVASACETVDLLHSDRNSNPPSLGREDPGVAGWGSQTTEKLRFAQCGSSTLRRQESHQPHEGCATGRCAIAVIVRCSRAQILGSGNPKSTSASRRAAMLLTRSGCSHCAEDSGGACKADSLTRAATRRPAARRRRLCLTVASKQPPQPHTASPSPLSPLLPLSRWAHLWNGTSGGAMPRNPQVQPRL